VAIIGVKNFQIGAILTAADLNTYNRGVFVFADAAARTSAFSSAGITLAEGWFSYLTGTNSTEYYDGAAWVAVVTAAPAGRIEAYAGATAPTGYLLCDGTAVSRTTYAGLFAVTSTTYGVGDGSTTFNVPDLRGRVPVGVGTNAAVNARALSDGVAVANRRPQHRHTPHTHTNVDAVNFLVASAASNYGSTPGDRPGQGRAILSTDGGSGTATDSLDAPAWLTVNYIISI
jgi:microcystin-dependent protein